MPAAGLHRLTNKRIQSLKGPIRLADGGGLFIKVTPTNSKSWLFSKMIAGKRITKGLGPYPEVSLATARRKAETVREALSDGGSIEHALSPQQRVPTLAGDKCELYYCERGQRFWTATVGTPVEAAHLIDLYLNGSTRWQN